MSDYKDIKKGIKRVELDKINYNVGVFLSIVVGCVVGFIFHNAWIGFGVFCALGVYFANKYFET